MQQRRTVRSAKFVLLLAVLALSAGGRLSVVVAGHSGEVAGETGVGSSPLRSLEVVLRTHDDTNDGVLARSPDAARALTYATFTLLCLILTAARTRNRLFLAGARVRSRSPQRHAVALRAPPALRLT